MKIFFVIIAVLMLPIGSLKLVGMDTAAYCDYSVGDTVQVYGKSIKEDFNVLLFVDVNSCTLCEQSFIQLLSELRKFHSIECNVYIGGANEVSGFKLLFNNECKVNADPIGAYRSFYHVKKYPFYIITNSKGKIIHLDKAGGTNSGVVSVLNLLNQEAYSSIQNNDNQHQNIVLSSDTILLDKSISSASRYYTAYNKISKQLVIAFAKSGKVFVLDSTYGIKKRYNLISMLKAPFSQCFKPSWIGKDSLVFLYDNFLSYRVFSILDTKTDSLYPVNFNAMYLYKDNNIQLHYEYLFRADNHEVVFPLRQSDHGLKTEPTNCSFLQYNYDSSKYKFCGTLDTIYSKAAMSELYYSVYGMMDNGLIMEKQNLSNMVNMYNLDGTLHHTISLSLDTNVWRYYCEDFPYKGSNQKIISAYNRRSFVDKVYDCGDGTYCFGYLNYHFDSKKDDLTQYTTSYYLHYFDINGMSVYDLDISIPEDRSYPFYLDKNKIGVVSFQDEGLLKVTWYKVHGNSVLKQASVR